MKITPDTAKKNLLSTATFPPPLTKQQNSRIVCCSPGPTEDQAAAPESAKPEARKRKPTKKQLEAAEAATRPVYDEATRPQLGEGVSAFKIVTWNVASLNSSLKKDPQAISRLALLENADVVCLQVRILP